jgi:hypothetical protein
MVEPPARYCGNCGNELYPEDQFCQNCGTPVHRAATVPTPEADVPVPPPPPQSGGGGAAASGRAAQGQPALLRALYAIAIASLVVAFVGFGISAFYHAPNYPGGYPNEAHRTKPENRTPEQEQKIEDYQQKEKAFRKAESTYNLVVASISIGAAVLLLVGSIVWLSRLPVIGDGVALGAVFTLFYGLIRAFMTNNEQFRFVAVAIGLVIVVALVYWRFVRPMQSNRP